MENGADKPNSVKTAHEQRFSAFISYSHADAAAVRKLHSQIESYRLPKGLGHIDALNGRQGKIGKVFRDREDLSAAQDLSVAVKDALGCSEVLVVACSPDAKASEWVDQEIAYFRERHPDRPILAAILRGEPAEAFPAALTEGGTEPLAADLRKQGDGWRLGFLKVVAGIAGVPLDRLVQRDTQRQLRRVMAVTGLVAVIAIAMGVMTTIALQARNEAQFQRDEADGMVAYMMTDLRSQLKGVGRYELMEGVNERALEYYTKQGDLSQLPPDSLEQRAIILHAMGEDDEATGDLDSAFAKFTEAHRATEELLKREPNNPDRIFAHAQSEYWAGFAASQIGVISVEQHWMGYLAHAKRLFRVEPGTLRSLTELGYSYGNLCELRVSQDRIEDALNNCRAAITYMTKAVAAAPTESGPIMALANRRGWLADTLMRAQQFEEAQVERSLEQTLIEELLSDDPENFQYQLRHTWPLIGRAEIAIEAGIGDSVPDDLAPVISKLAKLNDQDPANGEIAIIRVRALLLVAEAKRRSNKNWKFDYRAAADLASDYSDHHFSAQMDQILLEFTGGEVDE
ncbi:TIR domain-containing protein [uncultured Erythrobacter sp.]|uniref:TIR domain-containing protein n=1 Tax=uncultured Erythrobacter sp. TaxID=263913 RepID=UPI002629BAF3|nr:TIR domain-containing protein [uncultured Erythrobacter sp.]